MQVVPRRFSSKGAQRSIQFCTDMMQPVLYRHDAATPSSTPEPRPLSVLGYQEFFNSSSRPKLGLRTTSSKKIRENESAFCKTEK